MINFYLRISVLIVLFSSCSDQSNKSGYFSDKDSGGMEIQKSPVDGISNTEDIPPSDTLFNDHRILIIGKKGDTLEYITSSYSSGIKSRKRDTLYHDSSLTLIGDLSKMKVFKKL
jgi:hypothetical protein